MLFYLLALGLATIAAITDARTGSIPNGVTYPVVCAAPASHFALAMARHDGAAAALGLAGLSLAGVVACGAVPLLLWWLDAMGGGDVKLLGALGGLLLPAGGFELELCAFLVSGAMALAYVTARGDLARTFANIGRIVGIGRTASEAGPEKGRLARTSVGALRVGPSIAVAAAIETWMHWGTP